MTAEHVQHDTEVLAFRLKAVEYRATLSEASFAQLVAAKPQGAPGLRSADLSQLVYEVARGEHFTLPSVGQLARALAEDDRLTEARLFCDLWLELAPADADAHHLRAVLACRMHEFAAADRAFQSLGDLGVPHAVLWGIKTMILLAFTDDGRSAETAGAMLDAGCDMPWALPLAAEAAFRTSDRGLILRLARLAPGLLAAPPPRPQIALPLLRARLLELLASSATP